MSRYPSIYAGQRLTGTLLQSMMPDIIVKNTNEDRPSTTTLANDTDLVATLEANAVYHVVMYVHFAALRSRRGRRATGLGPVPHTNWRAGGRRRQPQTAAITAPVSTALARRSGTAPGTARRIRP